MFGLIDNLSAELFFLPVIKNKSIFFSFCNMKISRMIFLSSLFLMAVLIMTTISVFSQEFFGCLRTSGIIWNSSFFGSAGIPANVNDLGHHFSRITSAAPFEWENRSKFIFVVITFCEVFLTNKGPLHVNNEFLKAYFGMFRSGWNCSKKYEFSVFLQRLKFLSFLKFKF